MPSPIWITYLNAEDVTRLDLQDDEILEAVEQVLRMQGSGPCSSRVSTSFL